MLAELERERRAVALRLAGEERWIAADDAGLYRDALGAVPPGGLPEAFIADVDRRARAARRALRAHARAVHHRRARGTRYGVDPTRGAGRARARGRARPRRAAPGRHRARVVRPRRAAPAAPRVAGRPAQGDRGRRPARARARSCRAGRASTATRPAGAGSTACARCSSRCRGSRCPPRSGSATCCRAASAPTRPPGSTSSAPAGEVVWVGAGSLGRSSGPRRAVLPRGRARRIGPPPRRAPSAPARRSTTRCASGWPRRRASSPTCSPSSPLAPEELQEALWDLVWAGEVTNDAFAPLRAPRLTLARAQRRAARRAARRRASAHARRGGAARRSRAAGR